MNMLELKNVHASYGGPDVLKGIDLGVVRGEILGIIGPNGAGKSTLFRVMTGILHPQSGEALYYGRNLKTVSKKELARSVAVMPQSTEISFPFTVREFVLLGRYPHRTGWNRTTKEDQECVDRALTLTRTLEFSERTVTSLSGGERQRVFLAQAIAQTTELLLLDEPISHLDLGHRTEVLDLVSELNEKNGLTVVMVLHDLNFAAEYCHRLILMKSGEVMHHGDPTSTLTYGNIEKVFETVVVVGKNQVSGNPYIVPVSGRSLRDANSSTKERDSKVSSSLNTSKDKIPL